MQYLIGWALLAAIILAIWIVVRLAGGEREKPRASCGLNGCCGSTSPAKRR